MAYYDSRRGGDRYSSQDNGYGGFSRYNRRAPRRQVELPTEPPFTAFVGNLPFNITDDEVWSYFQEKVRCQVLGVKLIYDKFRPKGFGYVTFETVESLEKALSADGRILMGRELSIDVAEPKRPRRENRPARSDVDKWERGAPIAPRRSYRPPPRGSERPPRGPKARDDLPVPSDPPFVAFIGNLSYSVSEAGLQAFFSESTISNVQLAETRDGHLKGFGFVTFETALCLENALGKSGEDLDGRRIRVVVADRTAMNESEKRAAAVEQKVQQAAQTDEVAELLARLNLSDFASLFKRERVTLSSLRLLSEDDLKELGLPIGPRRLIQEEVQRLKATPVPAEEVSEVEEETTEAPEQSS